MALLSELGLLVVHEVYAFLELFPASVQHCRELRQTDPQTQLFLCGLHCITVSIIASFVQVDPHSALRNKVWEAMLAVPPLLCSCFSTIVVDVVKYMLALYPHTSGLQELLTPDEAYITSAMQGQMYVVPGLAQQQAAYAEGVLRQQQQPSRPVSPYVPSGMHQQQHQQLAGQMLNLGIGGMQPQATHLQMPVNAYGMGGNQVQHAMQPAPDRLGITPMQLAMLQQQRLQSRANNLVVTPSIHSVTSSNRSWSDGQ